MEDLGFQSCHLQQLASRAGGFSQLPQTDLCLYRTKGVQIPNSYLCDTTGQLPGQYGLNPLQGSFHLEHLVILFLKF